MLRPLTIGISAVVYFFASTGNFPCKYNNQLKLVLRMHEKINTNLVPSASSHFFSFLINLLFMLAGERAEVNGKS